MACRIEDAGFEIRDMIAWVYGSGFPKSLDVSKAIDKAAGAEREVVGPGRWNHVKGSNDLQSDCPIRPGGRHEETAPATPEAQQWAGWGTALKPALEPITMARKPFTGTVAANVLEYGTGALNVDGCRVEHGEKCRMMAPSQANISNPSEKHRQAGRREAVLELKPGGRWPSNLIHDGSDEVVALFPEQSSGANPTRRGGMGFHGAAGQDQCQPQRGADSGSAARFFYTAKATAAERQGVTHPTVKPLDLMAYLCRLVTPPAGIVLDPFMGSGTTVKAAISEGFRAIGIERDPAYFEMAQHRLNGAQLGLPF
jgi:site-specific DNA-methyltransferase (adenine-specific)